MQALACRRGGRRHRVSFGGAAWPRVQARAGTVPLGMRARSSKPLATRHHRLHRLHYSRGAARCTTCDTCSLACRRHRRANHSKMPPRLKTPRS